MIPPDGARHQRTGCRSIPFVASVRLPRAPSAPYAARRHPRSCRHHGTRSAHSDRVSRTPTSRLVTLRQTASARPLPGLDDLLFLLPLPSSAFPAPKCPAQTSRFAPSPQARPEIRA